MSTRYCRHIKTDGTRCGSFAVRDQALCYFHRSVNQRLRTLLSPPADPAILHSLQDDGLGQREPVSVNPSSTPLPTFELDFPPLEDRESIQLALSMLCTALGRNRIDSRRAGTMLYCLQVASSNIRDISFADIDHTVLDTTTDPEGNEIALDEDPTHPDIARDDDGAEEESFTTTQPICDEPHPSAVR